MSRVTEGSYTLSLKVAEVHLDQMQGKSSFGTWYKDAEVGNMIVKVIGLARQGNPGLKSWEELAPERAISDSASYPSGLVCTHRLHP